MTPQEVERIEIVNTPATSVTLTAIELRRKLLFVRSIPVYFGVLGVLAVHFRLVFVILGR